MLAEFNVRNFRNFTEWLVFSLETPDVYTFNREAVCNGIIKDAVIVGSNACGKTNLGIAVMDITTHLTDTGKRYPPSLLCISLAGQDSNMSFMYKFKFGRDVLEYSYEKTETGSLIQEYVKINGKRVLATSNGHVFVCLPVAEPLDLGRWDSQVSFARYVYINAMLDTENADCQVFLKFIAFVNKMSYFSSTEGISGLDFNSGSSRIFDTICGSDNGIKGLEEFLEEAGIRTALAEKDIPGGKTVYCKIGNKEVPFGEMLSSGMKALVLLYFWYAQRKGFSFVFIDGFDAFYHTFLSRDVIRKLAVEKNIQIVFTSHNTSIISNRLLRPDCYFILKDNIIHPLCNLTRRELKEGHNLQKMYKAGEFERQY